MHTDELDFDTMFQHTEEQEQRIRKRTQQRPEASDEITATTMFFHYTVRDEKGMNPRESHVPVRVEATSQKGTRYPKFLEMQCSVKLFKEVPDWCRAKRAPDGTTSWILKVPVGVVGQDPLRLLNEWRDKAYAHVSSGDHREDMRARLVRKHIAADGVEPHPFVDMEVHEGEMQTFRHPYDAKSVLFAKVPGMPHIYLVQPATPLNMRRLEPKVWLSAREVTNESPDGTTKVKEWVLSASLKFDCKLIEVAESNDASLSSSERLHTAHIHDRDAHQLIPVAEYLKQHDVQAARSYWYVAEYRSLANPQAPQAKGIAITLHRQQQRDQFVMERQVAGEGSGAPTVEYLPRFVKTFTVYQWTGMPSPDAMYVVTIQQEQDKFGKKKNVGGSLEVWQQWGIFDPLTYAEVMNVNWRVPFHVYAKSWPKKVREQPANMALAGLAKPSEHEAPNMRGYYFYGIEVLVPDYLRYFRGPHGVTVSADFIKREFAPWQSIKSGNRVAYELKMRDPTVPNAINDLGMGSAVVSIGNGQSIKVNPDNDMDREDAKYHAIQGDISVLLTGNHEFYVLCNKPMTSDETNKYCGNQRVYADDFISNMKREAAATGKHAHYWIFAVNKQARTVQLQKPPVPTILEDNDADDDDDNIDDGSESERKRAKSVDADEVEEE